VRFSDALPTEKFPIRLRIPEVFLDRRNSAQMADSRSAVDFSGESYKKDFTDCADYSDFENEERNARLRGCSAV
jgi:hypothetical protein